MNQLKVDKLYMNMALIWAENSHAIKRKVGCLIVKDRMIISDGYNGTLTGFDNICEYTKCTINHCVLEDDAHNCLKCRYAELITKPFVLHAEANAITKLAKSNNNSIGATLYVTDEPCLECSKLIIQSEIKRVVYYRDYHSHDGIQLLKLANIEILKINNV